MRYLVVGCAACVWDDLRSVPEGIGAIVAINHMGRDFPGDIAVAASVHHEKAREFRRNDRPFVSTQLGTGVDLAYDEVPYRHGTSALYAVGFCFLKGATDVVLAGVPIDGSGHYYDPSRPLPDFAAFRDPWRQLLPKLRGRVSSLSGWTRETLGPPT